MGLYDAVPVPVMSRSGAIKLLRTRFPELSHLFSDPDDPDPDMPEPYHSFGNFAREVCRRQNDEVFLASACEFIDDLTLSGQSILQEMGVEVLEVIAENVAFAANLQSRLHLEAQDILKEFLGR